MERIAYRAGYKYQLAADYTTTIRIKPKTLIETEYLRLTPGGEMTLRRGYAWDGPSGPAIDTKSAMRGSLVHDGVYQLIRLGYLSQADRAEGDSEYERMCREDNMSSFRAWAHFTALTGFGTWSASPTAEREILYAP